MLKNSLIKKKIFFRFRLAKSAGAVEDTFCISAAR